MGCAPDEVNFLLLIDILMLCLNKIDINYQHIPGKTIT